MSKQYEVTQSALDNQSGEFNPNSGSISHYVKKSVSLRFSRALRFLICMMEIQMSYMVSGNMK